MTKDKKDEVNKAGSGESAWVLDSANVCYTYGDSEQAVLFIDNKGCPDSSATVELSVKQLEYDGSVCPQRSILKIIVIVAIVATVLIALAVVCCIWRCCCR